MLGAGTIRLRVGVKAQDAVLRTVIRVCLLTEPYLALGVCLREPGPPGCPGVLVPGWPLRGAAGVAEALKGANERVGVISGERGLDF